MHAIHPVFSSWRKLKQGTFGPHALNLKLSFGEINVFSAEYGTDMIQLGLDYVEVISVSDGTALPETAMFRAEQDPHSP